MPEPYSICQRPRAPCIVAETYSPRYANKIQQLQVLSSQVLHVYFSHSINTSFGDLLTTYILLCAVAEDKDNIEEVVDTDNVEEAGDADNIEEVGVCR